jgi:hypothetical protein
MSIMLILDGPFTANANYPLLLLLGHALVLMATIAAVLFLPKLRARFGETPVLTQHQPEPIRQERTEASSAGTPTGFTPISTPAEQEEMKDKKEKDAITKEDIKQAVQTELGPLKVQLARIEEILAANKKEEEVPRDSTKKQDEANLLRYILNDLAKLSEQFKNLPKLIETERAQQKQDEMQRRQTTKQQRQEEKKRKEQLEMESRREALQSELARRFDAVTKQSDIFCIANLTKDITEELLNVSAYQDSISNSLPKFLELIAQAEDVRRKLDDLESHGDQSTQLMGEGLESEFKSLEETSAELTKSHRPAWFINLLAESSRHPSLQEKTENLKQLLKLEDICVEPHTELNNDELGNMDVKDFVGHGNKPFIDKVLEKGYRVKDSDVIIKKPRVIIRLEN